MKNQKLTKADLEQVVHEQKEQLNLMDKMLINKTDRTNELHIKLIEEQAKKRPILDANLWLGLKIGFTLGIVIPAIVLIVIVALF